MTMFQVASRHSKATLFVLWSLLLSCVILCCVAADEQNNHNHDQQQQEHEPQQQHAQQRYYEQAEPQGVDYSWPTHHLSEGLSERIGLRYHHYMDGCARQYNKKSCEESDLERRLQNLYQPRAQQNYTSAGYAKVAAPGVVVDTLRECYAKNQQEHRMREAWPPSNIYVNHWTSPTYLIPLQGKKKPALSSAETRELVAHIQPILETWSKMPLILTSLYGIREYTRGSILAPHVDRSPLIISAIIPVEQVGFDDGQEWPLQVIGHDGRAVNITMRPGEMVLYESHSIIHGRPYPMNGQTYASVFVHFEPLGHTERHNPLRNDPKTLYERAFKKYQQKTKHTVAPDAAEQGDESSAYVNSDNYNNQNLPYYVPRDKEDQWNQNFVFVREPKKEKKDEDDSATATDTSHMTKYKANGEQVSSGKPKPKKPKGNKEDNDAATNGSSDDYDPTDPDNLHTEVVLGNLDNVKTIVGKDPSVVHLKDINGWLPLHEAARAGHTHIAEYLIKFMDKDSINTQTNGGLGGSPLWWAEYMFGEDHPTAVALRKAGAKSLAPRTE